MRNVLGVFVIVLVFLCAAVPLLVGDKDSSRSGILSSGWGVDACLSIFVRPEKIPAYLDLLKASGITWLREREMGDPEIRKGKVDLSRRESRLSVWESIRARGFEIAAFSSPPEPIPREQAINSLSEDLMKVYQQGKRFSQVSRGLANAWELFGEPDTGYMPDLPDRVAAVQKALYLGIKAGALPGSNAAVLTGGLSYPPGPWLELACENGLYDYTDAMNFHHYGFVQDLPGVIDAHRAVARRWVPDRELPLWLTEVGLNNIPINNRSDSRARIEQANYIVESARVAIDKRLAVFMPFILVHRDDPYAMTESPERTWPAWDAYRDFTRAHSLPRQPAVVPSRSASSIVLMWLPDEKASVPSKISRSYWFKKKKEESVQPMRGQIRVYNFGRKAARVRLLSEKIAGIDLKWFEGIPSDLTLPPESSKFLYVEFTAASGKYVRSVARFFAEVLDRQDHVKSRSRLTFYLETPPGNEWPRRMSPLELAPLPRDERGHPRFAYISMSQPRDFSERAPWLGINGARPTAVQGRKMVFDVVDQGVDALSPPMAIVSVPKGLPPARNGFLRLFATDDSGMPADVRVDLIDADGQRFSIYENFGRNPHLPGQNVVYLGYADFHPWIFGRCIPGREKLDPSRVREIQLRFSEAGKGKRYSIQLRAVDFDPEIARNSGGQGAK
jgi:hypothetical protein